MRNVHTVATARIRSKSMESPCVMICQVINDVCIGCHRTLEQIENWTEYTDLERLEIMADINNRQDQD
ncbi:MAG: DUF1289 domain-containing protein [Euryarchaeota archaeon]|nr:DUF1289 domain-containing protein [Euryarchaeota archaeon]